jgi:hypothetical protein
MNIIHPYIIPFYVEENSIVFCNTSPGLVYCNEWLLRTASEVQSDKLNRMRLSVGSGTSQNELAVRPAPRAWAALK